MGWAGVYSDSPGHVVHVHFVVLFTQNEIIFYNTTDLKNRSLIPTQ